MESKLLTSLLFKFSPSTQELKRGTLKRILLNLLFLSDKSMDSTEIHKIISNEPYNLGLTVTQCERAIDRLRDEKYIEIDKKKIELTEDSRTKIKKESEDFNQKLKTLEEFLFKYSVDLVPFLEVLHNIFSKLGEQSIKIISGNKEFENNDSSLVNIAIRNSSINNRDKKKLNQAIVAFIKNEDPSIAELKWLLAQNSFLFRLLSSEIDESNFTKEAFNEAKFYLDTNVLLNAIEPKTRHHESYNLIKRELKKTNSTLYVFEQNIKELEDVLNHKYDLIADLLSDLPNDIFDHIDSFIAFQIQEKLNRGENINLEEIFSKYSNISEWAMKNGINVVSIDPLYSVDKQKVEITRERVKYAYKKRRGDTKHNIQANVDAKLLLAASKAKTRHEKTWVITLDSTLPDVELESNSNALVITIDALLQWLSIGFADSGIDYAKIFSSVLTDKLLPSERFFKIEDFRIFTELEKNVKELPKEDIIECITHIREQIGTYDLSVAEDREKLHYEVDKFFKRSDLKYKQNIIDLNNKLRNVRGEKEDLAREFHDFKTQSENDQSKINDENKKLRNELSSLKNMLKDGGECNLNSV